MRTVYCISGLGADERAFAKLKLLPGFRIQVLPWLSPEKDETIEHYATRMREPVTEENPVLMGLSFGGIMCTEIAKQIPVEKLIIISSIKTRDELPGWMKAVAMLRLNKFMPLRSSRMTEPLQNHFLGVTNEEDLKVARHYRKNADMKYVRWAVDQVVNWKNSLAHPSIYHIHGDNDKMFPIKKVKPDFTLKKGGHFMIMNRASEVSDCINAILQRP